MELHLRTRRFRCVSPHCPHRTFAEQHPAVVQRRGRRSQRLAANLTQIGLALGGQAGARLAKRLQMPVSGATLLRLVRQVDPPPMEEPRVIGIDDWALCKGKSYGTIVVDLEAHRPIDLLPSREGTVVKQWLCTHRTVEVVTRDRSGEYKDAVTQGAPQARQIADRWHLLQNLSECLVRHVSRRYQAIGRLAALASAATPSRLPVKRRRYDRSPGETDVQAARAQQRAQRFHAVKARHAQGIYTTAIAKEFNLSRRTVSRWVNREGFLPDGRGRFKQVCLIDAYVSYLQQRLAAGCSNQSQLWREIRQQGFSGDRSLVSRWIRQQGVASPPAIKARRVPLPSPRPLAWLLLRSAAETSEEEQMLWQWLQQDESLVEARRIAQAFVTMVRQRQQEAWPAWLDQCLASSVKELRQFAIGLKRDEAAVREAVTQTWSNE